MSQPHAIAAISQNAPESAGCQFKSVDTLDQTTAKPVIPKPIASVFSGIRCV